MKNGNDGRRSIAEVRASLDRSTQDLRAALERLELGARAKLDVGRRIAGKGPAVYIVGFLAGMVLGIMTARPRQRP